MKVEMATASKLVYSHIVKTPEVCGGKATIDDTRVRVMDVVFFHKEGEAAERIRDHYPDLSLEQIYAALSYYYGHKEEIEDSFRREDEAEILEEHRRRLEKHLARRTGSTGA